MPPRPPRRDPEAQTKMNLLSDPRLLNFVLLFLYTANSIRWAYERKWADSLYWAGALIITTAVTLKK